MALIDKPGQSLKPSERFLLKQTPECIVILQQMELDERRKEEEETRKQEEEKRKQAEHVLKLERMQIEENRKDVELCRTREHLDLLIRERRWKTKDELDYI